MDGFVKVVKNCEHYTDRRPDPRTSMSFLSVYVPSQPTVVSIFSSRFVAINTTFVSSDNYFIITSLFKKLLAKVHCMFLLLLGCEMRNKLC